MTTALTTARCRCTHIRTAHPNDGQCAATACGCTSYRPNVEPAPPAGQPRTIFERAAKSKKKSTRVLGERVKNLADDLRARLDAEDQADNARAAANARIAELRKQIAAEQAKLRRPAT